MGQTLGATQLNDRWDGGLLGPEQSRLTESWLEAPLLVADLSWGIVDTKVLHVQSAAGQVIVKTGGPDNHHLAREIKAHRAYTRPLVECGRAAHLLRADPGANLLVMEYLEGRLVEGTEAEHETGTYAQAGELLGRLHRQESRSDDTHEARATAKALAWLDRAHRIDPAVEREVRRRLAEYRPVPVDVVPTHGDWQPRNWLLHRGELRVIDFGRFDFRPAATDLCRLAVQQWRGRPALEQAFLGGYGEDPRSRLVWRIDLLREAIGTAVWAYLVGDEAFENQGHRMLREALDRW
ncbi:aminoglycoside phosphotransferase family protein [Pseudarthrobacter chlorophenolicus]|uniref:aminoglycoside phosphotransferase family protein n=1 Tax=Pseudarthrobacter chlorophenolicus TaxID=85085 RepID=UPI0005F2B031|nr:aminoglycoside phosphotransferase family protein [Pseudarthrobacter chlorophenolicus]